MPLKAVRLQSISGSLKDDRIPLWNLGFLSCCSIGLYSGTVEQRFLLLGIIPHSSQAIKILMLIAASLSVFPAQDVLQNEIDVSSPNKRIRDRYNTKRWTEWVLLPRIISNRRVNKLRCSTFDFLLSFFSAAFRIATVLCLLDRWSNDSNAKRPSRPATEIRRRRQRSTEIHAKKLILVSRDTIRHTSKLPGTGHASPEIIII